MLQRRPIGDRPLTAEEGSDLQSKLAYYVSALREIVEDAEWCQPKCPCGCYDRARDIADDALRGTR